MRYSCGLLGPYASTTTAAAVTTTTATTTTTGESGNNVSGPSGNTSLGFRPWPDITESMSMPLAR